MTDLLEFAREVAARLNATVVRESDADSVRHGHVYVYAKLEDGTQFCISANPACYQYKVPTACISPNWPKDRANYMHDIRNCYGPDADGLKIDHRAQAAVSRGAVAVAKDFGRRFLPLYAKAYAAACKRRDEADAYAAAKANGAAELAAIGPGVFKIEGDGAKAHVRWYQNGARGYGEAYVSGDRGYLEAKAISPEKLRRIMAIIAEAE